MSLDPQARAVLERIARAQLPPYEQLGVDAARELYRDSRAKLQSAPAEVARVMSLAASGPAGAIPLRAYRPLGAQDDERLPALVYFHGGGWVIGDLDTHDGVCRELANLARCVVVAVDYRLGPEHRFPAAVEDAIAATQWVARMSQLIGVDSTRLAIGGDSAGGNLAAVVALALRDDHDAPPLAMQVLIYPATDMTAELPSRTLYAEGYNLTRESIRWFVGNYLRSPADVTDWRASPMRAADLSNLPPAYVLTAGFDPLRDEGFAYAQRLEAAGVSVTYENFEGMIHGFIVMGGVIAAAHHALYRAAQALGVAFKRAPALKQR